MSGRGVAVTEADKTRLLKALILAQEVERTLAGMDESPEEHQYSFAGQAQALTCTVIAKLMVAMKRAEEIQ